MKTHFLRKTVAHGDQYRGATVEDKGGNLRVSYSLPVDKGGGGIKEVRETREYPGGPAARRDIEDQLILVGYDPVSPQEFEAAILADRKPLEIGVDPMPGFVLF